MLPTKAPAKIWLVGFSFVPDRLAENQTNKKHNILWYVRGLERVIQVLQTSYRQVLASFSNGGQVCYHNVMAGRTNAFTLYCEIIFLFDRSLWGNLNALSKVYAKEKYWNFIFIFHSRFFFSLLYSKIKQNKTKWKQINKQKLLQNCRG